MSRNKKILLIVVVIALAGVSAGILWVAPGLVKHLADAPQSIVLAESNEPALPSAPITIMKQAEPVQAQAVNQTAATNEPALPMPSLPPLTTTDDPGILPAPELETSKTSPSEEPTQKTPTQETKTVTVTPGIPPEGLTAWCLPKLGYIPAEWKGEPYLMPDNAQEPALVDEALDFTFPFISCTFVYTTDGPFPKDAELEVYDLMNKNPWLKTKLLEVPDDPNSGYAVLKHAYIVEPPLWFITYRFVVRGSDGKELKSDLVNIHKWRPTLCWDGSLPDPITEYCPSEDQ